MSALLFRIIEVSNEVMVVLGKLLILSKCQCGIESCILYFYKSFLNLKNIKVLHEAQLFLRACLFHVSGMHFQ